MNRAARKQQAKRLELLHTPNGKEVVKMTTEQALTVLKRDFGFGDKRINRFLDGMMGVVK